VADRNAPNSYNDYRGVEIMQDVVENKTPDNQQMGGVEKFAKGMATNTSVIGEVMQFLWERKLWWMIPMVTVLLLFGLLLVFASSSGVAPFIYTLF
jgi:hypothetical protein